MVSIVPHQTTYGHIRRLRISVPLIECLIDDVRYFRPDTLPPPAPVIKRADLGEKGVYYRAMVGPFGTPDEASQFCGSLKTAGGQCVVQRN